MGSGNDKPSNGLMGADFVLSVVGGFFCGCAKSICHR